MLPTTHHPEPLSASDSPGGGSRHLWLAIAIGMALAIVVFAVGMFAFRGDGDRTNFGVMAGDWPKVLQQLHKLEEQSGFRVRYAHRLPPEWLLVEARPATGEGGATDVELVYRHPQGYEFVVHQRRMLSAPPDSGDRNVRVAGRAGVLRLLGDDGAVVGWWDGEVYTEASTRFRDAWQVAAFLEALDAIY